MKKRHFLITYLHITAFASIIAQGNLAPSSAALSLGIAPTLQIPIGSGASDYSIGGSSNLYLQYDLSQPGGFFLRGAFEYAYSPYVGGNSLSLFSLAADAGYTFAFAPRFRMEAFGGAGYNYGFKNQSTSDSGSSLYATGGLGVDLLISPTLGINLGGTVSDYFGLPLTAGVYLGSTVFLSGKESRQNQIRSAQPIDVELIKGFKVAPPGKGLSIDGVELESVFPVFRKYYDDHPVGIVRVKNNERQAVSDATISLFIKEYMDAPKTTSMGRIEAGSTAQVSVFGLFNDSVLGVTEATKAAAEVSIDYRMSETPYRAQKVESMRILDRNAMTWDDDRRAAAFVTAKDPAVLSFSKNVSGFLRDFALRGVDDKLAAAVALHEALALYGITYIVDPKSSYAEQSTRKSGADFLQFPRQTLAYKGGDCDDLSILNCALLESIGVDTAFITIPGHIYMAFALDLSPVEAKRVFSSTDDLILKGDVAWVPIEITDITNGFFHAWRTGAREWRDNDAKGAAAFYPMHKAWDVFEAVGLPGSGAEISMPPKDKTIAAFSKELNAFIEAEIRAQAKTIEAALVRNKTDRDALNRYGILYARYGRFDEAIAQFNKAIVGKPYAPVLVNLGNVAYLRGDWKSSRDYYEKAVRLDPSNPRILLGVARAAYELNDSSTASDLYAKAKALDSGAAQKFAYLGAEAASGVERASDATAGQKAVFWEGQ